MEWQLAHPIRDVEDIISLGFKNYLVDNEILNADLDVARHRLTMACTEQIFNRSKEFVAVCRSIDDKNAGNLLGFCWFDRGGYTSYSNEEISNAKFHHVDLGLPVRTRVRLINEMIDQHILWANTYGIPVVCSTSIRADHDGFMKIHKKRGFTVNGSYAWIRTEKGMKCLINQ